MSKVLKVPYLIQYDSNTSQGPRMCFSSSCSQAMNFLHPGKIDPKRGQIDDQYLMRLEAIGGDTTDAGAQIRTLASYDVAAKFRKDGNVAKLKAKIDAGKPVPIGILHHGHVSKPTGGGHWICVVGYDTDSKGNVIALRVNDPAGDLDLVNGGYIGDGVPAAKYSCRNLLPRWEVDGPSSGWLIDFA